MRVALTGMVLLALAGCDMPLERKARRALDDTLRDAESARFKDLSTGPTGAICGMVNAKNGAGAYSGWQFFHTSDGGYIGYTAEETDQPGSTFYADHTCACYSREMREKFAAMDNKPFEPCPSDKP